MLIEFLLKYSLFFLFFILISLLANSTIYLFLSQLFNSVNKKFLFYFSWFLFITSISFILLSVLGNFYENFITRLLYFISALIFGFIGYVFSKLKRDKRND